MVRLPKRADLAKWQKIKVEIAAFRLKKSEYPTLYEIYCFRIYWVLIMNKKFYFFSLVS